MPDTVKARNIAVSARGSHLIIDWDMIDPYTAAVVADDIHDRLRRGNLTLVLTGPTMVTNREPNVATKKNGVLTSAGEWWKHLRWMKRVFWKKNRRAEKIMTRKFRTSETD